MGNGSRNEVAQMFMEKDAVELLEYYRRAKALHQEVIPKKDIECYLACLHHNSVITIQFESNRPSRKESTHF